MLEISFLKLNTWICIFWSSKYVIATTLLSLLLFVFYRPPTIAFYRLLI